MDETKGVVTAPALGVSLNAQFAAGRQVVFQTHVAQDISEDELNKLLDTMNAVADRAEAYYGQDQARKQLEVEEKALLNMTRRLSEIEGNIRIKAAQDNRRGGYKPSATEEVQKKQAYDTLEEGKSRVATCRQYLDELIRKAGNRDGTASTTNS